MNKQTKIIAAVAGAVVLAFALFFGMRLQELEASFKQQVDYFQQAIDELGGGPTPSAFGITYYDDISADTLAAIGTADENLLTVTGYTTQTSDLLVIEQSGGTDLVTVTNAGLLGAQDVAADTLAAVGDADEVLLTLTGYTTQTSNLLLLEQSDGTDVLTVTNGGTLTTEDLAVDDQSSFGGLLTLENGETIDNSTDGQVDIAVNSQNVFSVTQPAAYFNNDVYLRFPTLEKTASYTFTTQDSGALLNNKGATAEITVTLPSATSGLGYCFYVYAAYTMTIQPATGDQVHHLTNATADRVQNAGTAGDSLCIYAADGEFWLPMQEIGTWSDAD